MQYVSIIWLKRQKANFLENITWSDCENKKYTLIRSISQITPSLELVPSFTGIPHYRNHKGEWEQAFGATIQDRLGGQALVMTG